ncbi:FecR family protein [Mariniflexile jejuense]|uniref:FecR family protein n=1 Tax=Mariniflexile jejuense TaxID=1173582 RepID=A0ABW3JJ13_9FLAO
MNTVSPNILKLISKYTSKNISEKEFLELKQWLLDDSKNEQFFIEYLKKHKKLRRTEFLKILNKDAAWNTIISKLENPLTQTSNSKTQILRYLKPNRTILKYAAVAILFLSIGYLYKNDIFLKTNTSVIPTESITLQLENGDIKIIQSDGTMQLVDAKGNQIGVQTKNQIVYSNTTNNETLVYNTLTVPYGKRFEVQLSDGTIVHLNSGTSLKYPVKFIKGKNREVFLTGEAFFTVTKDKKHPFIVNAENLNVEVLGTEFNVSAYPEDTTTDVVLVEGSVGMYKDAQTLQNGTMLIPSTKGTLNKKDQQITTQKVNTLIYTSWIQGGLFFRNIPFENIAKKLERHYNKKIIITNEQLKNEIFNANFNDEPIEKILSYFSDSYNIKYKITNNTIYIN